MKLIPCLLTAAALLSLQAASAQDKLYRRDGGIVDVKVKEIGNRTITYVRWDNTDGPTYVVNRNEVTKIVFQNGSTESMDVDRFHRPRPGDMPGSKPMKYRKNLLAVAPIQITTDGIGVGANYERILDDKGIFSLYVPVIYSFNNPSENYYYMGTSSDTYSDHMLYVCPGLKFYPTGAFGRVRYAVGPSLAVASGTEQMQRAIYDQNGNYLYTASGLAKRTMLGVMVNNSLNINPSERLYLGIDMGLGFTYINRLDGRNAGTTGLFNMGFRIGVRF